VRPWLNGEKTWGVVGVVGEIVGETVGVGATVDPRERMASKDNIWCQSTTYTWLFSRWDSHAGTFVGVTLRMLR
jgi:hypothetical protein